VLVPLDEDSLHASVRALVDDGISSIAVVLLHAYANPEHELRCEKLIAGWFPEVTVSLSHRIANEWREYERTSTTVVNAAIAPTVDAYLKVLEERLRAEGMSAGVHVMQSNGGMTSAGRAREQPVNTLLSGPVGGAIAAASTAGAAGYRRAIGIDMGGTSFDVTLCLDGRPQLAREASIEGQPLLLPVIDVQTVGAGGGSVGWSSAGALRVGPRSAGSVPGPASYGLGGTEPTVTDANVHLDRVNADYFLGGRMALHPAKATAALDRLGAELGLTAERLAEGMLDVVNARMAQLIRALTVGRGLDPREFALVAFGGAGPMHAVFLAEELDIGTVLVPYSPGTLSAQGMLAADVRRDVVRPHFTRWDRLDRDRAGRLLAEMRSTGRALLAEDGVTAAATKFELSADLRYVGQEHFLTLPFTRLDDRLLAQFHRLYKRTFGHANTEELVELVNLRLAAIGVVGRTDPPAGPVGAGTGEPYTVASVGLRGRRVPTPRYRREELAAGQVLTGPLVVDEASCTTVVPDGWRVTVADSGLIRIEAAAV
jgi:N-methylhydantoinase A